MRDLNILLNKCHLNSIVHTVSLSKLAKEIDPNKVQLFEEMVNQKLRENEKCNIQAFGAFHKINNLKDMAKLMYFLGLLYNYDVSLEGCYNYIKELFVDKAIYGFMKEREYLAIVQKKYQEARLSTTQEDINYAVDIIVPGVCGVQVKPKTYKSFSTQEDLNRTKNSYFTKQFNLPVKYVFYDGDKFEYENI